MEFRSISSLYPCLEIPSIEAGCEGFYILKADVSCGVVRCLPVVSFGEEVIRGCGEDVFRKVTSLSLYCGLLDYGWVILCEFGYHLAIT